MSDNITLKKIPLPPIPEGELQRDSCEHDQIDECKSYLVKIDGEWFAGRFSRQWYGWNFDEWGCSGIQLDSIVGPLFEIEE